MFKQRLHSLAAEKWRESIIMKNAFILSCHSSFSLFEKHRSEKACALVRPNMSHSTRTTGSEKNNSTEIKKQACCAGAVLILNDEQSQTASIKKTCLMMIDKHWLYLTPTHDYTVFIYPPLAPSPSALFG